MADYRDRAHYHLDDSGNGSIHTQYCNSQSFKAPANFGNTPVSNSVHQTDTLESVGNG